VKHSIIENEVVHVTMMLGETSCLHTKTGHHGHQFIFLLIIINLQHDFHKEYINTNTYTYIYTYTETCYFGLG